MCTRWRHNLADNFHNETIIMLVLKMTVIVVIIKIDWSIDRSTDWLRMLLVSRSGLMEENALELDHHYGVH